MGQLVQFHLASTFIDSLARLTAQDQKAVKASALDLQLDPSSPGLQFHRIDRSKDPNFWSIRVNRDIRIIVHKTASSMMLAYVDHHDDAYAWAERRRIETHPNTGATQIVEVRERVEEVRTSAPSTPRPQLGIFAKLKADDLLAVGVPSDWVADVLAAADEDRFLELAIHLPSEAGEALLAYAAGERLEKPKPAPHVDPLHHPDALRRFRIIDDVAELQAALDAPWDKWTVYLHPSQRAVVDASYSGPARAVGSAGTGKTVVALHRAARMAQSSPNARVLLTTFSQPLANELERKVKLLLGAKQGVVPRIVVASFQGIALELYQLLHASKPFIASHAQVRSALEKARQDIGTDEFSLRFLMSEWETVVDPWQVADEASYAAVPRVGRARRLGTQQRARLWPIFARARDVLGQRGMFTQARVMADVACGYLGRNEKPFTHIVVDEAQDLGVAELRMLAALAPANADSLFFAGDLGQRIFVPPFSWKALGVDVRGRSTTLKVNYRTSHQIRQTADRLLARTVRDADGLEDDRMGTVSTFNGPTPEVEVFASAADEEAGIAKNIRNLVASGFQPADIGVFVRSDAELPRGRQAIAAAGASALELSERAEDRSGKVSLGTMHLAKGLEFKAVIVMACDANVLPSSERIEAAGDETELEDVFQTERHLLYVACTRARDRLLVSGVKPASEFLDDLGS
jgi:plasmid maintenance system killer protein